MAIDDKIRDEKLQYDINREAPIIAALSFSKVDDKYEYLTGERISCLFRVFIIKNIKIFIGKLISHQMFK